MVKDVMKCKKGDELLLNTNGGQRLFDEKGVGVVIPVPMYYNENSIGTIYSVKDVLNIPGARITYDLVLEKIMNVLMNQKGLRFEKLSNGLYGMLMNEPNRKAVFNYSMIQTVE